MKSSKISIVYPLFNANISFYFTDCLIDDWWSLWRVMIIEHDFSSHWLELVFSNDNEADEIAEFLLDKGVRVQTSEILMPLKDMN